MLADEGVVAPVVAVGRADARACGWSSPPWATGFILPDAKVAVLSESDVTGRRGAPPARPTPGSPHRRLLR